MNMQRRFGLLTAIAGAALALGSLTFAGSATAVEQPSNHHDHTGNRCPAGTTQFNGQIKTGHGSTALFHWAVTGDKEMSHDKAVAHGRTAAHAKYVTITRIDPTVTGLTAYLKGDNESGERTSSFGGHDAGYRIYSPVISGQQMHAPLDRGHHAPDLSRWFLCYTITPPVTTTTTIPEIVTTTTVVDTTTTIADTTTTVADTTTTTIGESGGPTTTLAATTTTELASEGPTTTVDDGPLPTTGGGTSLPLVLGLAMMLGGVLFTLLARTPRES